MGEFGINAIDLIIHGGTVATPGGFIKQWVAVDGGKIVAMGMISPPEAKKIIDATGKQVLPGVIDSEHHPNITPPEETIFTESRAAIATGITTIGIEQNAMIFARPPKPFPNEDELPSLLNIMPTIREFETNHHAMSDYFFTPILTSDRDANEIPDLAKDHGVTSFKIYLHAKSGQYMWPSWGVLSYQGFYHYDDGMIYNAMRNIASLGPPGILGLHCENWEICRGFVESAEMN
jgi:dihydroorotase-like cyclic amidohydrolase